VGVVDELVASRHQRPASRPSDADANHVATELLAALRKRDVVGVSGDKDHVRDLGMAHEVLDSVYGEPDVSTVLDARGGEQLNEVKRSLHQLVLVCRIRGDRPVSVGPAQRHAAEGRGVVDDRPDIDLGRSQLHVDRVRGVRGPCTLARVVLSPRLLAVNVVVTGNHHIVEVEVDSNPFAHGGSLRPLGNRHAYS
jgi:hypothetical protein